MKYLVALLLVVSLPVMGGDQTQKEFISYLLRESPDHDGAPLRHTEVRDLDGDGVEEILLLRNEVEERAVGYLNVELYEALVWIDIYKKTETGYKLSTGQFKKFNAERKEFYSKWLERIERRSLPLTEDSKEMLDAEPELFRKKINEYIAKIESYGS